MHLTSHSERLKCPYEGCEKDFEKPTVQMDCSTIPRQTYYACPYCNSKLDIVTEGVKIVKVAANEYPKVFESPAKCAQYSGLLDSLSNDVSLPDDCLVCPKVLQCSVKRRI